MFTGVRFLVLCSKQHVSSSLLGALSLFGYLLMWSG